MGRLDLSGGPLVRDPYNPQEPLEISTRLSKSTTTLTRWSYKWDTCVDSNSTTNGTLVFTQTQLQMGHLCSLKLNYNFLEHIFIRTSRTYEPNMRLYVSLTPCEHLPPVLLQNISYTGTASMLTYKNGLHPTT